MGEVKRRQAMVDDPGVFTGGQGPSGPSFPNVDEPEKIDRTGGAGTGTVVPPPLGGFAQGSQKPSERAVVPPRVSRVAFTPTQPTEPSPFAGNTPTLMHAPNPGQASVGGLHGIMGGQLGGGIGLPGSGGNPPSTSLIHTLLQLMQEMPGR